MTVDDVFKVCRVRGVSLVITGNQLRARGCPGSVNDALRQALAVHKQTLIETLGDGIWFGGPDETLPDVIHVPKHVPYTLEAIRACIDGQRQKAA